MCSTAWLHGLYAVRYIWYSLWMSCPKRALASSVYPANTHLLLRRACCSHGHQKTVTWGTSFPLRCLRAAASWARRRNFSASWSSSCAPATSHGLLLLDWHCCVLLAGCFHTKSTWTACASQGGRTLTFYFVAHCDRCRGPVVARTSSVSSWHARTQLYTDWPSNAMDWMKPHHYS